MLLDEILQKKEWAERVYRLIILYALGGFMGFVVEVVWCGFIFKQFEWRSGMLFTPFNPVYGLGAVALSTGLTRIPKKRVVVIFLLGAVVGTLVELFCSYFQEFFFQSFSWDYRHLPFNFEGRICLYMSLAWGLLSVLFSWVIAPFIDKIFKRIPTRLLRPLALSLGAVILIDGILTVTATARFVARVKGYATPSPVGRVFDFLFPDARMRFTFPRIIFYG